MKKLFFISYNIILNFVVHRPSPFIYHPFSSGHRSCIGKIFAFVSRIITVWHSLESGAAEGEGTCILHAIEIQIHTKNWALLAVYVYNVILGISNGCKYIMLHELILYFKYDRVYTVVACSFTTFSSSYYVYAPAIMLRSLMYYPPSLSLSDWS